MNIPITRYALVLVLAVSLEMGGFFDGLLPDEISIRLEAKRLIGAWCTASADDQLNAMADIGSISFIVDCN